MSLDDLMGRHYGPSRFDAGPTPVAAFIDATGDDPDRWRDHAPPGLAAAALFTVAPAFLTDADVAPFTRSVVHTEQEFTWYRGLPVGEQLTVTGSVTGVRSRGSLHVVTFTAAAAGADPWLDSTSTFLLSAEAAAATEEEPEPAHDARGPVDPAVPSPLPAGGGPLPEMRRSASRADLVRYAGVTGDWNPIHWDHHAARGAGLPGIVVHGLLTASWLAQAAGRHARGPVPLRSMRVRFRAPLRPAAPAAISGRSAAPDPDGTELSLEMHADGRRVAIATVRVTP
jgi:acyl dehydratase